MFENGGNGWQVCSGTAKDEKISEEKRESVKKGMKNGTDGGRRKFGIIPMVLLFLALTACTASKQRETGQKKEEMAQGEAVADERIEGTEGMEEKAEPEKQADKNDTMPGAEALEGQIKDQSFAVELDGWGNVIFASFAPLEYPSDNPNYGTTMYGDVRFMLLSEEQAVYIFPGETPDDMLSGMTRFLQVVSVAFKDYDEDGRTDILLLLEYADAENRHIRRARIYTQEEGEKEFRINAGLSEYLGNYTENMSKIEEGIRDYRGNYSLCTDFSAWEVERFAKRVRRMVLEGDYEGLASECAYPVTVDGAAYENKEALLASGLLQNLPQSFVDAVREETAEQMFCNWQGIMLGDGEIFLSEVLDTDFSSQGLKIIAFQLQIDGASDSGGITGTPDTETDGGLAGTGSTEGITMSEEELMDFIKERSGYYTQSVYYDEIMNYWENVREVRDISYHMEYLFETDRRYLTKEELADEPPTVIHLAKNEIYARHGYIFRNEDLYHYFLGYTWYMPVTAPEDFSDAVLNAYEKANLELLDSLDTL